MNPQPNQPIYRIYAPIYDGVFGPLFKYARRRAIEALSIQAGEKIFVPGIGTGLDLPFFPEGCSITGIDISQPMLAKARAKVDTRDITLLEMDAQALQLPDAAFDVVVFNLVLSVVPDGAAAFREGWRVLRAGGRAIIFDKFLAPNANLNWQRRWIGQIVRALGTDPNRRLDDVIGRVEGLTIDWDKPSLLRGQYRIIHLTKS